VVICRAFRYCPSAFLARKINQMIIIQSSGFSETDKTRTGERIILTVDVYFFAILTFYKRTVGAVVRDDKLAFTIDDAGMLA
jgi:hypothetical protein